MTNQKRTILLSLVIIACIVIALLGSLSLYGTLTRTDNPPVLVDGRQYPNADVAGIAVLVGDGISGLALFPQNPLAAIPALSAVHREALFNSVVMTLAVTAIAVVGVILSACLLARGLRNPKTPVIVSENH